MNRLNGINREFEDEGILFCLLHTKCPTVYRIGVINMLKIQNVKKILW